MHDHANKMSTVCPTSVAKRVAQAGGPEQKAAVE